MGVQYISSQWGVQNPPRGPLTSWLSAATVPLSLSHSSSWKSWGQSRSPWHVLSPMACSEPCGMFWLFCMLSLICTRQVDSVHFEQSIGIVETPCIRERKGCFAAKIWIPYPRRQTHLLSRKLNAIITSAFPSLIVRDTVPHSQSDASDRRECCALNKLIEESALNKGCRQSFRGCRSVGRVLAAHA